MTGRRRRPPEVVDEDGRPAVRIAAGEEDEAEPAARVRRRPRTRAGDLAVGPASGADAARPGTAARTGTSASTDGPAAGSTADAPAAPKRREKKPLYPRLLRLRHIQPNAWQRAALGEGAIGVGVLLAMADLATAWGIVVIPVAVAAIVKAHDALQGVLDPRDDRGDRSGDSAARNEDAPPPTD